MKPAEIFRTYEEAALFFRQADFEEALNRFNRVILEGANTDDDMILKVVNAALTEKKKCQYRLVRA